MKHLSILVPEGEANNLSSIVGSYKLFTRANDYYQIKKNKKLFTIQLVGVSKSVEFYDGLFVVKPHANLATIKKTNLIIIPSLNHNYQQALKRNKTAVDWIKQQYNAGSEVASICTGAFLLASSGLLNNQRCSTHWSAENDFKHLFPEVKLEADRIITDENGLYTNGGAYSFLNLITYLIEKYYDRNTALYCTKVFQIEPDRDTQSEFIIFSGQKMHNDETIKKAQNFIEKNIQEKISVDSLSKKFALSRRNFDRRFISATANTPVEYMQKVKMEAAKRQLENSSASVEEIMYRVSYTDNKAFRTVFKKVTGLTPLEYRNKYNKESLLPAKRKRK